MNYLFKRERAKMKYLGRCKKCWMNKGGAVIRIFIYSPICIWGSSCIRRKCAFGQSVHTLGGQVYVCGAEKGDHCPLQQWNQPQWLVQREMLELNILSDKSQCRLHSHRIYLIRNRREACVKARKWWESNARTTTRQYTSQSHGIGKTEYDIVASRKVLRPYSSTTMSNNTLHSYNLWASA